MPLSRGQFTVAVNVTAWLSPLIIYGSNLKVVFAAMSQSGQSAKAPPIANSDETKIFFI